MTVKSAVSFIDEHHAFAKVMVERGEFASVSAVVAAGIQRLRDEEAERKAMLEAMAEEIRRRAEAPDEEFVEHTPGDFARILERMLAARRGDDAVQGCPASTRGQGHRSHRGLPARVHDAPLRRKKDRRP